MVAVKLLDGKPLPVELVQEAYNLGYEIGKETKEVELHLALTTIQGLNKALESKTVVRFQRNAVYDLLLVVSTLSILGILIYWFLYV
jgi:hypothetical protein